MKNVILITNSFPFGIVEAGFLAPEYEVLKEKADVYTVTRNTKDKMTTSVPEDRVFRYASHYGKSGFVYFLKALVSPMYYRELAYLKREKKLAFSNAKRALTTLMRAFHFETFLKKVRSRADGECVLYTYWNDYTALAAALAAKNGDRVVSRIHRADLYLNEGNGYYIPYKNEIARRIDKLVFISRDGMDYYRENFEIDDSKCLLSYLGVKEGKRPERPCADGPIKILSFSYMSPVKRVDRIIDALSLTDGIKAEWTHIGSGMLADELKEKAERELKGKENIKYELKGYMNHDDAMEYISDNSFDFLLNVSSSEGLPVTMMECMARGMPVMATDVGGVCEIVENGKNGFMLKPDFTDGELVSAIKAYAEMSADERQKMSDCAYKKWQECFDCRKNYLEFCEEILFL